MKQGNHRLLAGKGLVLVLIVGAALVIAGMTAQSAPAASIAPSYAGSVFGGFTTQTMPSFFQLSKNEKMLVVGSIALKMKCASGVDYVIEDDFMRLPITASGKLQGDWAVAPSKLADGTIFGGSGVFKGHLDRRRQKLTGTWQVHETFVTTTGQSDQCDSGVVRFTALQ